jgi:NTP pyrophosphatase (non-canonical NTP hydrolase)
MRLDLEKLKLDLRRFAKARAWEKYHSPKNLSMALAVEASELLERFQWLTEDQSRNLNAEDLRAIEEEIADVQIYLVRLADKIGIDLGRAVSRKMRLNHSRYPANLVRGSTRKYTAYNKK